MRPSQIRATSDGKRDLSGGIETQSDVKDRCYNRDASARAYDQDALPFITQCRKELAEIMSRFRINESQQKHISSTRQCIVTLTIEATQALCLRRLAMGSFRLVVDAMKVERIPGDTRVHVYLWLDCAAKEMVSATIRRLLPDASFAARPTTGLAHPKRRS